MKNNRAFGSFGLDCEKMLAAGTMRGSGISVRLSRNILPFADSESIESVNTFGKVADRLAVADSLSRLDFKFIISRD